MPRAPFVALLRPLSGYVTDLFVLLGLLVLPGLLGACRSGAPVGSRPDAAAMGGMEARTTRVGGAVRAWRLHRPAGGGAARPLPLVFAFHGAGSTIDSLVRASGLNTMADAERFLVAYPQGIGARFDTGRGSADVRFVQAILEELGRDGLVDRRRVYATGFSNGGFLCYRLVADLPGVFAGIAPVAGLMARDALPASGTPTSLLHVHGTADRVVSARGRGGSLGAAEGVEAWARMAGCGAQPAVSDQPGALPLVARRTHYSCPRGTEASLLLIDGAGHTWPQAGAGWLSRTILAFFKAHALP